MSDINGMRCLPCPIPYQGSKRRLAGEIVRHLPLDTERLFEPFCGSAAVSLAAAAERGEKLALELNDSNAPLAELWSMIVDDHAAVADGYADLWSRQTADPRAFYDTIRDGFNRNQDPISLLYLLARCVKAAVRYNANGEFNQSPDNRRLGSRPERMRSHLAEAARLTAGHTTVRSVDFVDAVATATPRDVIYLDPPYQGASTGRDRRYRDALDFDRFVGALERFDADGLSFIVSYDGRTGTKTFGRHLPTSLGMVRHEICAGRSAQATLSGGSDLTYESLYLSEYLVSRIR